MRDGRREKRDTRHHKTSENRKERIKREMGIKIEKVEKRDMRDEEREERKAIT